jgi:putative tricarboxylic transport membrane protein
VGHDGRELAKAMQSSGAVKNVQFDNKGGAAGTIGLAQFVNSSKGDPNALMMGGMVMVGGIVQNNSAVKLSQVTPVARLTSEYEVIVVPANGPEDAEGAPRQVQGEPGQRLRGAAAARAAPTTSSRAHREGDRRRAGEGNYVPFKGGGGSGRRDHRRPRDRRRLGLSEFAQHIKSGKMRALAVSSPKAMEAIRRSRSRRGRRARQLARRLRRPGITPAQRDELIKVVQAGVKSKAWQESLRKNDWSDFWLAGEEYGRFVEAENKRLATSSRP